MPPLSPSDVGVDVGHVIEGKYRVDAILGRGGMGVVVACTHLTLGERYALKLLRRDVLTDHDSVQRFIREARAAVKLKSEHVAKVSDVGTYDQDLPYMVMEYLEGQDMGELLEERHTLAIPWATDMTLQACEALAEAHSLGIVHRDIKPSNLFVTWRPDGAAMVKILDFGISKSPVGTDMKLTQTQSVLGTPAYMSPEQMRSAHMVDSRSDIWSLGCVLYEMLEGQRPFEADSFSEMCVKVAVDAPRPMEKTPPELVAVVMRCLHKQADLRFPTMADLGRALVQFAPNQAHAHNLVERMTRTLRRSALGWDGEASLSLPAVSRARVQPEVTDKIEAPKPPRRKWPWELGVFGFGAIAAALVVVLLSRGGEAPAPLPTSFLEYAKLPPVVQMKPVPVPVPVPVQPPVVVEAPVTEPVKIHHGRTTGHAPGLGSAAATSDVPTPQGDAFTVQHPGQNK